MSESSQIITALKPTQRDPTRVTIRICGRVAATLPRKVVDDLHIAVGTAWTDQLAEMVAQAADHDKAYRYALNALGRRAMSCGEMRDRIRRRGFSDAAAQQVVEHLTERGWLDDEKFGRAYIEQLRSQKPAGPRLIAFKLRRKKLDPKLISRLIDHRPDATEDDAAGARRLAEQKLRSTAMRKVDPATRRRRLWGMLGRRGFMPDVIVQVLEELAGRLSGDEENPS